MARLLSPEQKELLRSPDLAVNVLLTFYLDEGIFRFCDDHIDLSDGTHNYIGASSVFNVDEIKSGASLAAESVTVVLDGNRMTQAGIEDPAKVLVQTLSYLYVQRRVDTAFALRYNYSSNINMIIPAHAGKINSFKMIDPQMDIDDEEPAQASLELVLDSLAIRYRRMTNRTRSHPDQLALDPTDMFFSFTADAAYTEKDLYWGKKSPTGTPGYNGLLAKFDPARTGYRLGS